MKRAIADQPATVLISRIALVGASIATAIAVVAMFAGSDALRLVGISDSFPAAAPLISNGLIWLAWLVCAFGIGMWVLRAIRVECGTALRVVVVVALGLGIMSLLVLGLGCAGVLNRFTAIAILVVGVMGAVLSVRGAAAELRAFFLEPARVGWMWLLLIPVLSVSTTCAMLPPGVLWRDEPNGYDVTEYHLQIPREWFEAGRIVPLQHNVFSYFPFNAEMHYLLAMHLRGGPWNGMYLAQLMHVAFIALTVLAIYGLLVDRSKKSAIIACAIAGGTPWFSLLAPVAYNEGGLLLFGTLAIGLALRALREPNLTKWMILAGVMAGFACGSKLTAGPMILIPLPMIVALARFAFPPLPPGEGRGEGVSRSETVLPKQNPLTLTLSRRARGPEALRALVAFWFAGALVFSPWLIRNLVWTRNPVFPEATYLFGKAHWTDTQVERWTRANHVPRPDQQNLPGRFRAAWDQILADPRYGYVLLPLGVISIVLRRDRESICLGALLLFQMIFWLCFTHLQSRFFILSIPICALLIGGIRGRAWEWIGMILAIAVAIGGTIFTVMKLNAIEQHVAGYQIRLFNVAGIATLRDLSQLPVADDGRIYELVGEGQAFLYDIPMKRLYYRTVFDVDAQPGETAEQAWRKGWPPDGPGVYVIRNDPELERFHRTYWQIPAD